MKICLKCKKEYKEDIKFCPTDGTALLAKTSGMSGGKIYAKGDVNIRNTNHHTYNQIVDDGSLKKPIKVWVKIKGKIWDPIFLDKLRRWVHRGIASNDDSVSYDGKKWKEIKSFSEMKESPDEVGIQLIEIQKLVEISKLAKDVEQKRREDEIRTSEMVKKKKLEDLEQSNFNVKLLTIGGLLIIVIIIISKVFDSLDLDFIFGHETSVNVLPEHYVHQDPIEKLNSKHQLQQLYEKLTMLFSEYWIANEGFIKTGTYEEKMLSSMHWVERFKVAGGGIKDFERIEKAVLKQFIATHHKLFPGRLQSFQIERDIHPRDLWKLKNSNEKKIFARELRRDLSTLIRLDYVIDGVDSLLQQRK